MAAPDPDVLTRTAPPPDATVRYGDHPDQVVDLRLPTGQPAGHPAPLVVVVHGGFWRQRYDRAHAGAQSAALASAGYAVATIEYRRVGGDGGWPATFDDIATGLDAVPRLAVQVAGGAVDPTRAVLVGHSAGGHLVLWASCRHLLPTDSPWYTEQPPRLAGVVSLAGVTDLRAAVAEQLGSGAASELLQGAQPTDQRSEQVDPAQLPGSGVPTALVHGLDDPNVPARYSIEHARRLHDAGTPVSLYLLARTGHFELIDPLTRAWPTVLAAIRHVSGDVTTLSDRADRAADRAAD